MSYYLDNFKLGGQLLTVRDKKAQELIATIMNSLSDNVGDKNTPIYLTNGNFKVCISPLNIDINGSATHADDSDNATNATHANTADTATNATHANTADMVNADYIENTETIVLSN